MRTLKLLVALIVVATLAACGSPDEDRSALDTLEPPPSGEVQDSPPPGASTSTSDVASAGPDPSTTNTTTPLGAPSTSSPDGRSMTASTGATGTTRPGGTSQTTDALQTDTTTRVGATTQPSGPTPTTSPAPTTTPASATTPLKKAQTISFTQPTGPWAYGAPKTVQATASSGLSVAYDTTGSCEVDNAALGIFRATDVGECSITASQAGDGAWKPAPSVTRSITTSKAIPVIEGFVGRQIEYPRNAFSIPLTAFTNEGAVVRYRMLADEYGESFCTIAGAELQVPSTSGLPRTCDVEAYVEASRLFVAADKVVRFEITKTVIRIVSGDATVSKTSATISVVLNRVWSIYVGADCGTPTGETTGRAEYSLTLALEAPITADNPCTVSIATGEIDGAHTSDSLNIPLPLSPP